MVKDLPAVQETWVRPLSWEGPLEKGMATHSSILAWRVPWTEQPGGPQSMTSQRTRHAWVTTTFSFQRLVHTNPNGKTLTASQAPCESAPHTCISTSCRGLREEVHILEGWAWLCLAARERRAWEHEVNCDPHPPALQEQTDAHGHHPALLPGHLPTSRYFSCLPGCAPGNRKKNPTYSLLENDQADAHTTSVRESVATWPHEVG